MADAITESAFSKRLVAGDRKARSWREKLVALRDLLVSCKGELDADHLTDVAVYLRFLGTGEIACEEDGHHYRPSHHARIATEIREQLVGSARPEHDYLLRRIHPRLPSGAAEFVRSEPLTRIRDIAHRNDIPRELKREIKTTLQNKLHRCAGPEDLVTSQRLLDRITQPDSSCSRDFVEQFRIFHKELSEFFNASSLDDRLAGLEGLPSGVAELVKQFIAAKSDSRTGIHSRLVLLELLTRLRRAFPSQVGVAGNKSVDRLLADIALEDFSFVLLAECLNKLHTPFAESLRIQLLRVFKLGLANLPLSGVEAEECGALESETAAWLGDPRTDHDSFLRWKATLERGLRLADSFGGLVIRRFARRAARMGDALGVGEHAIRMYCEGEIRGSLIFQLSRLTTILLKDIRERLSLPSWEVLVPGVAAGRVRTLKTLADLDVSVEGPQIVLLEAAGGDEEIPSGVGAIILEHDMPHLSHLGVRARQAKVVFVASSDSALNGSVARLSGKWAEVRASEDSVKVNPSTQPPILSKSARASPAIKLVPTWLKPTVWLIQLDDANESNAGAKAAGARKLEQLAKTNPKLFRTPESCVVPFGVLERAIQSADGLGKQFAKACLQMDKASPDEAAALSAELREVIGRVPVPEALLNAISRKYADESKLMVRSSSNCEDLDNLAGAGLYESVGNVPPSQVADAIRKVWSSLWTKRAVMNRSREGITHSQSRMAVLVQQMVEPEYSFIVHTVNPISFNASENYVEWVVGFGEALASGTVRGTPYRMLLGKERGTIQMLAFANFARAWWPGEAGEWRDVRLDYSQVGFSCDPALREHLGRRLLDIARLVEETLGGARDIEGVFDGSDFWLVQSRAQQGLSK